MKIRHVTLALALAAAFAPGLAWSACSGHDRQAQITCGEGQSWDAESQRCVTVDS